MAADGNANGFVLACDANGVITKVYQDDFGLPVGASGNLLFVSLFTIACAQKALDFLVGVKQNSVITNCELELKRSYGDVKILATGCRLETQVLVIGSPYDASTANMISQLLADHNEQINRMRLLFKGHAVNTASAESIHFYDELTRLNNDLITIQREVFRKNKELEALNNLKNQFVGMVAHDLRGPIGIVLNCVEILNDDPSRFTDVQLECINHIQVINQYMLNLVNELLDIHVIESGNLKLIVGAYDVGAAITRAVLVHAIIAAKKNIAINQLHPEQPIIAMCDEFQVQQVLSNLLNNAIKYARPGDSITVSVEAQREMAVVCVQDTGPGIPANEQELLFQPFHKTSVRPTGGERSTGLGLTIVRRIIESQSGKVWVKSEVGEGSAFYFSLPLSPDT